LELSFMSDNRVLVVDDEAINLMLIEDFLEQEQLMLELFTDPLAAWQRLAAPDSDFALVVLDRMMPGMDGIEFLRRVKAERRFADVPVIMQTAASAPEQVREGLEAGAYYYLTKPYAPEALISIVRAALEDRRARVSLRTLAAHIEEAQKLLICAEYGFSTLEEISCLVPVLAGICPEPDRVAPGLSDLMVNAVEHGNLGISYREKSLLKWDGDWEGEIRKRLAQPEFRERRASVRIERTASAISFRIADQGRGFDWRKFLDFDPERVFDPNGRGIAMARMTSFSRLRYEGCGNVVVATVDLPAAA
jgi:CheY-like chemotaxis protein